MYVKIKTNFFLVFTSLFILSSKWLQIVWITEFYFTGKFKSYILQCKFTFCDYFFIFDTKVQPNMAHSNTEVIVDRRSRLQFMSKFPKNESKTKHLAISLMLLHPETSSHLLSHCPLVFNFGQSGFSFHSFLFFHL